MTDALTRAAEEAEAAVGLPISVVLSADTNGVGEHYLIIAYGADSIETLVAHVNTPVGHRRALAYLEGLEAGARIATVRYEALVGAATAMRDCIDNLTTAEFQTGGDHDAREALRAALKELEE